MKCPCLTPCWKGTRETLGQLGSNPGNTLDLFGSQGMKTSGRFFVCFSPSLFFILAAKAHRPRVSRRGGVRDPRRPGRKGPSGGRGRGSAGPVRRPPGRGQASVGRCRPGRGAGRSRARREGGTKGQRVPPGRSVRRLRAPNNSAGGRCQPARGRRLGPARRQFASRGERPGCTPRAWPSSGRRHAAQGGQIPPAAPLNFHFPPPGPARAIGRGAGASCRAGPGNPLPSPLRSSPPPARCQPFGRLNRRGPGGGPGARGRAALTRSP